MEEMKNIIITLVVVVIIALGVWFYSTNSPESSSDDTGRASSSTETADAVRVTAPTDSIVASTTSDSVVASGASTPHSVAITVVGTNYEFDPATMTMHKGDVVRLTFKNSNGFHDFRIDELMVATRKMPAGQEDTVEFTPDKVGTFEYYCSIGNHRAMGMRGTLTVTE